MLTQARVKKCLFGARKAQVLEAAPAVESAAALSAAAAAAIDGQVWGAQGDTI